VYKKNLKGSVRGIIKHYNNGTLADDLKKSIKRWLLDFVALFIVAYFWVIYFSWNTDYNFLIAIYPFIWHYMFFRYFLWEKEDLLEHSPKK
jgi:hypothetical protein